jgi:hypothetical protein
MNVTTQPKISASKQARRAFGLAKPWSDFLASLRNVLALKLAASRLGRIALHLLLAFETGHYLWHWRGIARELAQV